MEVIHAGESWFEFCHPEEYAMAERGKVVLSREQISVVTDIRVVEGWFVESREFLNILPRFLLCQLVEGKLDMEEVAQRAKKFKEDMEKAYREAMKE